ncbi:hypothetical protein PG1770B_1675 [Bifidobacterium pseudolongum subsp. globosum]|uniref:hypothetical protein n=1 Tax=Bifidobacterium pseudolongum TaxID=1694 RepID=UPI001022266D|nr:hypothetical protein [Bifidobacterium pseudolongum]MCH4841613.1 hypothetical protein [Bifidobacterium pseudolongum]RYQ46692.1 hypothetical protein PG1770B_1675 [Bifidobacterium pseudolongum subsp. globosum]
MSKPTQLSETEKGVRDFIRAQMGLHGENGFSLSKKTGRSYTYTRERVEGLRAWTIADVDALSALWGIPVLEFFSQAVKLR